MSQKIPWLRVLAEGVIIVGSILLAFGIDAGWDARQERELERSYIARIAADLRATQAGIDDNAVHYSRLLAHAGAALPILEGGATIPDDTLGFLSSVLQATRITSPIVARSAYDDLISTGNLRLIRSDTLRHELSRFYGEVEVRLDPVDYSGDQMPFRTAVRSIMPVDLQLLLREECFDYLPLECNELGIPQGAGAVAPQLVSEPGLVRMMTVSMQAKAVRIGFALDGAGFSGGFGVINDEIEDLLSLLAAEYGS
jgi:hypothetical protein